MQLTFELGHTSGERIILILGHDIGAVEHIDKELTGFDLGLLGLSLAFLHDFFGHRSRFLFGQFALFH